MRSGIPLLAFLLLVLTCGCGSLELDSRAARGQLRTPPQRKFREETLSRACLSPTAHISLCVAGASLAGGFALPPLWRRTLGVARGLRFWRTALPIYVEYRLADRRVRRQTKAGTLSDQDKSELWQNLHAKHAPNILGMCVGLRGFYVKLGQVCSTRSDMFPTAWTRELERLQGGSPELLARPLPSVMRVVRHELGAATIQRLVSDVEASPLGAAATGQVHRARLTDGREVVLKVQYPEAERLYRQDFATTKMFCALLQREHLSYLRELEAQFKTEFDYRREASDLAEISARLAPGSGHPYEGLVQVPKPVLELSSRHVVTMEYLDGETLLGYARRKRDELQRASLLWSLWQGWWLWRELHSVLTLLIGVQGHQIFVDGVFNGDPHPGNVLRLTNGRLGLIDYGNVKRLSPPERALMAELVLALASEDQGAVVVAAQRLGFQTRDGNPEAIFRYARIWFDRDDPASLTLPNGVASANPQLYLERLNELDPLVHTPEGYLMVARSSFLLRGLGTHFGLRLRMAQRWKAFAQKALTTERERLSVSGGGTRVFCTLRGRGR